MNKLLIALVGLMIVSTSFVVAESNSTKELYTTNNAEWNAYHGLTPCQLSEMNKPRHMNFFNPIQIPKAYCTEDAVKPKRMSQIFWDWMRTSVY